MSLSLDKCEFRKQIVEFLGHTISDQGISPKRDKTQAIMNARPPKDKTELRSFLGLVVYVGSRHVPHVADGTVKLRQLLVDNTPFKWMPEHQKAFDELKSHIASADVMGYYSLHDDTFLYTDASPWGLGAVLIQRSDNGKIRPIAYASHALSKEDKKLAQNEKEAFAIVWSMEHFEYYLRGRHFILLTDHEPLKVIFGSYKTTSVRLQRFALRVQDFDYEIQYVKGPKNIADCLSRLIVEKESLSVGDAIINIIVMRACPTAITINELTTESENDITWAGIRQALMTGVWPEEVKDYKRYETQFTTYDKILLYNNRIAIPDVLREKVLNWAHTSHQGATSMRRRMRERMWWANMERDAERKVSDCAICKMVAVPKPVGLWYEQYYP